MDRVSTAVELFRSAQVEQLIMSGARREGYDEPGAMQAAAIAQGVPESAVLLDPLGISTLDSCLNFKENFGGEVVIVTQDFHLPRAIFLARKLGLPASGVAAHIYRFSWYKQAYWRAREILAMPYNIVKYFLVSK
jgi:SanA protein